MNKFIPFWWISVLVIFLDQVSKYIVRNIIDFGSTNIIKITENFFWLTHVQNTGAAFSLSFGNIIINKIFFIIFTVVAVVLIVLVSRKSKSQVEKFAFALILGGAIGNLIDRIVLGSVTDFIWWDFPDFVMQRWPVFNIADSSIVIALTILIVYTLFFNKKKLEEK
ncbi:MAG: signal peptidase II [Candidatus Cloacimonas sp. 4484_275]|nr:MAG: signal peptidase II [Candidatus Cloacimonas sp. 4484_275]